MWPRPGWKQVSKQKLRDAASHDSTALVAQHEPGGQPGDEAHASGGRGARNASVGRGRGNHRAASSLQGRLAQRHGSEVRRDRRPRDGPDRSHGTAARGGPANGRTTRSAITPCASATIRASTRSSSACSAKRSRLTVRATNRDCYAQAPWPPPSSWPAKPRLVWHERRAGVVTLEQAASLHFRLFKRQLTSWQLVADECMAKCEEGYLCDVCGGDVEAITDSDLYLRYVVGLARSRNAAHHPRASHPLQSSAGPVHRRSTIFRRSSSMVHSTSAGSIRLTFVSENR